MLNLRYITVTIDAYASLLHLLTQHLKLYSHNFLSFPYLRRLFSSLSSPLSPLWSQLLVYLIPLSVTKTSSTQPPSYIIRITSIHFFFGPSPIPSIFLYFYFTYLFSTIPSLILLLTCPNRLGLRFPGYVRHS